MRSGWGPAVCLDCGEDPEGMCPTCSLALVCYEHKRHAEDRAKMEAEKERRAAYFKEYRRVVKERERRKQAR